MKSIAYKDGYKYQLKESYTLKTHLTPPVAITTEYIQLTTDGTLWIKKGYAWDGASGPAINTLSFRRGSLVHDALYQLIRGDHLDREKHRKVADEIMREICKKDGMCTLYNWVSYQVVRWFGGSCAVSAAERPLLHAPDECAP
ncbi:MAG: DUF1353 domain-containing protein [Kiritimatiellia bacterium]|nr:DUF1353 domain-containing protein [Kiritimatiellia bacterium]